MKKEAIICVFIIAIIIVGNIITQNYTKKCVAQMNETLDILKEASLEKETNAKNIENKMSDVERKWNEKREKLSYYIEHDELEKVETQIFNMRGLYEIEKYEDIVPELEKCVYILEHIKDKTTLNIKNIF